ncbi:hypothetical protein [Phenylobacterium kunshanense]|uniref:UrcA family protein n=1 Tax=Phenylobacterium kunshanense TaxID=1445034 RepID=A0A328BEE4_9CAUL|nr:hypothetical protein [Phenylobacterium kunshanense]RAK64246.1 hypothetical protein DJ019_13790 [Phenylobacterium kunshanense]
MKFACLAAASAAALVAMPAAAADLRVSKEPVPMVRISLIGKTDAQVSAEIKNAAATVCNAEAGACVQTAVLNANRQYTAIKRARDGGATKVEVIREDRASVRVKIAGRSMDQIHADIDSAAKAVCKAVGSADFRTCVDKASRNAKTQLRDMQVASIGEFAAR